MLAARACRKRLTFRAVIAWFHSRAALNNQRAHSGHSPVSANTTALGVPWRTPRWWRRKLRCNFSPAQPVLPPLADAFAASCTPNTCMPMCPCRCARRRGCHPASKPAWAPPPGSGHAIIGLLEVNEACPQLLAVVVVQVLQRTRDQSRLRCAAPPPKAKPPGCPVAAGFRPV